jgi:hypothetical protein
MRLSPRFCISKEHFFHKAFFSRIVRCSSGTDHYEQPDLAALFAGDADRGNGVPRSSSCGVQSHAGANCSAEDPPLQRNTELMRTQTDVIFQKFQYENEINCKNKCDLEVLRTSQWYLSDETICRPPQSLETFYFSNNYDK